MGRLNIELFKKVRERIATIPESYNQDLWQIDDPRSPCGTAACLAGETIICAADSVAEGVARLKQLDAADLVAPEAAMLLGLDGDWDEYADNDDVEAGGETLIFDASATFWPKPFQEQFWDGDESGAAVALLDRIIETGTVPLASV